MQPGGHRTSGTRDIHKGDFSSVARSPGRVMRGCSREQHLSVRGPGPAHAVAPTAGTSTGVQVPPDRIEVMIASATVLAVSPSWAVASGRGRPRSRVDPGLQLEAVGVGETGPPVGRIGLGPAGAPVGDDPDGLDQPGGAGLEDDLAPGVVAVAGVEEDLHGRRAPRRPSAAGSAGGRRRCRPGPRRDRRGPRAS